MNNNLLEIKNLTVEFPTRRRNFVAVKEFSIEIKSGEIYGLVGESGAGKSTVGNAIMGLVEAPGRVSAGQIFLQGETVDVTNANAMKALRGCCVSMIFQDPLTSLNPLLTVQEQLGETIKFHLQMNEREAEQRAIELLDQVGIPDPKNRITQYPHQFSGGMRQRIVIALALCSEPDLIIADEPTTALDVSIQAQILELIKKLCREQGLGVILVTHDMGVIAETTDRVAVMYKGEVVERGKTADVLRHPTHDYTRALLSAVPRSDVKLNRFPLVTYRADKSNAPHDINLAEHWLGRDEQFKQGDTSLLEVKNIDMDFVLKRSILPSRRKTFKAVSNISFEVAEGEVFGLVGESGSGKSTIARIIAGLYQPSAGAVIFNGQKLFEPRSLKDRQLLRRQIQMIFQDPYSSLNPRMRVRNIVAEPIQLHGLTESREELNEIVDDLLERVALGAEAGQKFPHEFSGGQRQRISIARALATRPRFLICDEPTSALDVSIQAQILNLVKDLQEALNLTILFISHDLPVIRQMCDRIGVMQHGEIVEVSETEDLFCHPVHPHTQSLIKLMPRLNFIDT